MARLVFDFRGTLLVDEAAGARLASSIESFMDLWIAAGGEVRGGGLEVTWGPVLAVESPSQVPIADSPHPATPKKPAKAR